MDNASAKVTVNHLQSLLQHPLLGPPSSQKVDTACSRTAAAAMLEKAMFQRRASVELIDQCLDVHGTAVTRQNTTANDSSGFGMKLASWFTSSDLETKLQFLASTDLLGKAVPVMYASGQEELVWEWLNLLYERGNHAQDKRETSKLGYDVQTKFWVNHECYLTFFMIREVLRRKDIHAAIQQFVQACGYMKLSGRISKAVLFSRPWRSATVAVLLALLRNRHRHGLSAALFDDLLAHREAWSDNSFLAHELITMYHPTAPSIAPFANTISAAPEELERRLSLRNLSNPARQIVLTALMEGVQLVLEHNACPARQLELFLDLIEDQHISKTKQRHVGVAQQRIESIKRLLMPQSLDVAPSEIT